MNCCLGVYEKSMPDNLNINDKLLYAKNAGFDFLEISIDESDEKLSRLDWSISEKKQLYNQTREVGLYIDTMCLSGHRRFPLGSSKKDTERRSLEIMKKAINLASDIGIRIIQVAGYDVYYEPSTVSTKERFFENLFKSTIYAAEKGVILALETMENDFMNTIEKAMYYVESINSPFLQVYPDIGNITNATDNVAYDIRKGMGHIAAAHLKETKVNVFRDLKYGEGHVDFAVAVKVLKSINVMRYNAEFWCDGSANWCETLKSSHDFLRPLLESQGD